MSQPCGSRGSLGVPRGVPGGVRVPASPPPQPGPPRGTAASHLPRAGFLFLCRNPLEGSIEITDLTTKITPKRIPS